MPVYTVEVGFNDGAYAVKLTTDKEGQAYAHYCGYNVHSGGKRRLKRDGVIVARLITHKSGYYTGFDKIGISQ